MIGWSDRWSADRKLLAGAYLTMEYAIDSAALFNPSIVPHPDQHDVPRGALRFIMSLRATGEGHVSSIVFRTGVISADNHIHIDSLPRKLHKARIAPDRLYVKHMIRRKMAELNLNGQPLQGTLDRLPDRFTLAELTSSVTATRTGAGSALDPKQDESLKSLLWLAQSNYHIDLAADATLDELVIFPMSENESNGMEDLRLTQFTEDDGNVMYYGTYTAYNGVRTLPMLLHSSDFRRIEFATLKRSAGDQQGHGPVPPADQRQVHDVLAQRRGKPVYHAKRARPLLGAPHRADPPEVCLGK